MYLCFVVCYKAIYLTQQQNFANKIKNGLHIKENYRLLLKKGK